MDNETIRRARRKYLFSEDEKVLYDDEGILYFLSNKFIISI